MFSLILTGALALAKTDLQSCPIHLAPGGKTLPVVRIDLSSNELNVFAPDHLAQTLDWDRLLGRTLRVVFRSDRDDVSISQQRLLSREDLIQTFPDLAGSVEDITSAFQKRRSRFERSFSYLCLNPTLKRTPWRTGVQISERCYPGEFGKFVLRMPTELWTSERLWSWAQSRTGLQRLFTLHPEGILEKLQERIENFAYDYNSLPRPLLRVYFVHNHPGVMGPLSPTDLKTQSRMADYLSGKHRMFDFELVMVALAHHRAPGDVAFVRTVSRIRNSDGLTSTWTADGEATTYESVERGRLNPQLNPGRRRRR